MWKWKWKGEGVSNMSVLQYKKYFVKWSKRGGGQNVQKTVHMIYGSFNKVNQTSKNKSVVEA